MIGIISVPYAGAKAIIWVLGPGRGRRATGTARTASPVSHWEWPRRPSGRAAPAVPPVSNQKSRPVLAGDLEQHPESCPEEKDNSGLKRILLSVTLEVTQPTKSYILMRMSDLVQCLQCRFLKINKSFRSCEFRVVQFLHRSSDLKCSVRVCELEWFKV